MTLSLRPQPQPILQSALAWLKAPAGDPLHDLAALRQYLKEAAEAVIPPAQRLKLLELLQARTDSTSALLLGNGRRIGAQLMKRTQLRARQ